MSESKFGYWHRQTLREKEAKILKDWKSERDTLLEIIKIQGEALENIRLRNGDTRVVSDLLRITLIEVEEIREQLK